MANQTVEIGVSWSFNVQVTTADVIDGLIVHHEGAVRVFQGGVSGKNGVVWFHYSCGDLRCWVDGEFQFGLLSIVNGQTLHEQRCETRASSTTKRMEDKKTLEACALVSLSNESKECGTLATMHYLYTELMNLRNVYCHRKNT